MCEGGALKRKWFIVFLFVTAAMAPRPGGEMRVTMGRDFVLKVGQSAVVERAGASVRFDGVIEDSRCPRGAMCIRAGNARVAVTIEFAGGRSDRAELNTAEGPKEVVSGGLKIGLVSVDPYPVVHRPIDRRAYTATLVAQARKR